MARGAGSTFDGILPIAKKHQRRGDQLGLRRRQDADHPAVGLLAEALRRPQPTVWFHDIFRNDGTPYRESETRLIRDLIAAPTPPG